MSLNPAIAQAILKAEKSIYFDNFFLQQNFTDPTAYVRVILSDQRGQRSTIEVVVGALDPDTSDEFIEDVRAFCEAQDGLAVKSVEPRGLIGQVVTITLG